MDDYNHEILIKIEEDEDVKENCTKVIKTEPSHIEESNNSSPTNLNDYQKTIDGLDETGRIKIEVGETEDYNYKYIFESEQQKTIDEHEHKIFESKIKVEDETDDCYDMKLNNIDEDYEDIKTDIKEECTETCNKEKILTNIEKSYISCCMPSQNDFLKEFDGNIYKVNGASYIRNKKIDSHPVESRGEIEYIIKIAPKDQNEDTRERRLFYCDFCGMSYHTKKQIRLQLIKSHKRSINKCSTPKPTIVHGNKYTNGYIKNMNLRHKCEVCFKNFLYKSLLTRHELVHAAEKPHKCNLCSKTYTRKYYLTQHEMVHTGEMPYRCEVCLKSFARKSHMTRHQLVHTGERPFKCAVCSMLFSLKSNLTKHKLVHLKEKPYKCNVCSKSYSRKDYLRQHQIVHTGDKPYHCLVCSKSFSNKSHFNRHQLVHTGEKPYKCNICSKSFNQKGNLAHHKFVHVKEKPYKCTVCLKSFSRKVYLIKHLLVHNG